VPRAQLDVRGSALFGGNVGVGTTNPGIILDVGSSLSNPQIGRNYALGSVHDADKRDAIYFGRWDGTGRDFLGMKCRVDTHTNLGYGDYSNQTKLEFYTWGNNYASTREVMCIRGDGNVGIGTDTFTDTRNTGGLHLPNSKGISFAASTNSGSRHWRIRTDDFSDHGTLQIGVSDDNATHPDAADEAVMTMNRNRYVGIGTTSPAARLHVKQASDQLNTSATLSSYANGTVFERANTTARWTFAVDTYNSMCFFYNLARKGYLLSGGTDSNVNFTGQHRTFIKDVPFTRAQELEGLIVSADQNKYIKMSGGVEAGSNAITTNESLPVVSLSKNIKDKKCFGVISTSEDPDKREEKFGVYVTTYDKELGDTRVYINSVGEGAIWVTNINGPLESGDYITTSNVAGYGMKQDSEFLANYTVAKITMDCDFNPVDQPVQRILKELGNVNYWVKTTYSNVTLEEYSNLTDENRTTTIETVYTNEEGEIFTEQDEQSTYTELTQTIYQKIEREESKTESEGYDLEVRQEMVNVLDEHGQLQWEDTEDTEKAYKIRYLTADGTQTDEANAVHTAAFVGCTYHCG